MQLIRLIFMLTVSIVTGNLGIIGDSVDPKAMLASFVCTLLRPDLLDVLLLELA